MSSRITPVAIAAVLSVAVAAAGPYPQPRKVVKKCTTILESEVCAWVATEGDRAVELGATIPMSLVTSVPDDAPMVWPPDELGSIPLPDEAKKAWGIDHLGVNWEAHGHPPATFLTPHFDFHFYSISPEDVRGIDCSDLSKPDATPADYTLPDIDIPDMGTLVGLCVPNMGMHAIPTTDMDNTDPFGASMIVGYYAQNPIFFEPMIAQNLLLRKKGFTLPMPKVEGLPGSVRYPTSFQATYDSGNEQYQLTFSGF